jgi:hypothetical protein
MHYAYEKRGKIKQFLQYNLKEAAGRLNNNKTDLRDTECVGCGMHSCGSTLGPIFGCYENGRKSLGSTQCW